MVRTEAETRITYHLTPQLAVSKICLWFNGEKYHQLFVTVTLIQQIKSRRVSVGAFLVRFVTLI
jgi:hypothetical protein